MQRIRMLTTWLHSISITFIEPQVLLFAGSEVIIEQFEISDERPTEEITAMLKSQGLDVVWKDWANNWEKQAYVIYDIHYP